LEKLTKLSTVLIEEQIYQWNLVIFILLKKLMQKRLLNIWTKDNWMVWKLDCSLLLNPTMADKDHQEELEVVWEVEENGVQIITTDNDHHHVVGIIITEDHARIHRCIAEEHVQNHLFIREKEITQEAIRQAQNE
jgi:hypothetical protein